MLCECKYKLNGKKRNSKQNWNSYKCQYDCQRASCMWNGPYLES